MTNVEGAARSENTDVVSLGVAETVDPKCNLEFCSQQTFRKSYQRNNKTGGKKHLRCFPMCGKDHKNSRACEVPLRARFVSPAITADSQFMYIALARFLPLNPDGKTVCVDDLTDRLGDIDLGAEVAMTRITQFERSADAPFEPLYSAKLVQFAPSNVLFEFRERAWHYGWKGGRYKQNTEHILRLYVFEGPLSIVENGKLNANSKEVVRCVARLSSPVFTVYSSRSAPKPDKTKVDKSPYAESDKQIPAYAHQRGDFVPFASVANMALGHAEQPSGEPSGLLDQNAPSHTLRQHAYSGLSALGTMEPMGGTDQLYIQWDEDANFLSQPAHGFGNFGASSADHIPHASTLDGYVGEFEAGKRKDVPYDESEAAKRRRVVDSYYETSTETGSVGNSTLPSTSSRHHASDYMSSPSDSLNSESNSPPRQPSEDPIQPIKEEEWDSSLQQQPAAPGNPSFRTTERAYNGAVKTEPSSGPAYSQVIDGSVEQKQPSSRSQFQTPATEAPFSHMTMNVTSDGAEADDLLGLDFGPDGFSMNEPLSQPLDYPGNFSHHTPQQQSQATLPPPPRQQTHHHHQHHQHHGMDNFQDHRLVHRASSNASVNAQRALHGPAESELALFDDVGANIFTHPGDTDYQPPSHPVRYEAANSYPARQMQVNVDEDFPLEPLDLQRKPVAFYHHPVTNVPQLHDAKRGPTDGADVPKDGPSHTGDDGTDADADAKEEPRKEPAAKDESAAKDGATSRVGSSENDDQDELDATDSESTKTGDADVTESPLDASKEVSVPRSDATHVQESKEQVDSREKTSFRADHDLPLENYDHAQTGARAGPSLERLERDIDLEGGERLEEAAPKQRSTEQPERVETDVSERTVSQIDPSRSARYASSNHDDYPIMVATHDDDDDGDDHESHHTIPELIHTIKRLLVQVWRTNPCFIIAVISFVVLVVLLGVMEGIHMPPPPDQVPKECRDFGIDVDDIYAPPADEVRHLPGAQAFLVHRPRPILNFIHQKMNSGGLGDGPHGPERRALFTNRIGSSREMWSHRGLGKLGIQECLEEIEFFNKITMIRADKLRYEDRLRSAVAAFGALCAFTTIVAGVMYYRQHNRPRTHSGTGIARAVELTDVNPTPTAHPVEDGIVVAQEVDPGTHSSHNQGNQIGVV
ncbi:Hypothetical Protein FCC1311_023692 [Hondaea fermentalgiana]|uniref:Uncharacterized protein n=1 Tax=Hondaea fermentalgiana TaxID=2315210 RepID=A0A2R5G751_9STRA|nr:Hypothetical Protein FCC1311_023692 [Hondaea fermentalgiana]|eukprot:GBG26149.1 Hypothetical Protein FCC1311_023692 [Hondaea fermentalgiana]